MAYTPPAGNAANASWVGASAYTPPAGNAADATWQVSGVDPVTGVGYGAVPLAGSGEAAHYPPPEPVFGAGYGAVTLAGSGAAGHGVAGAGVGAVPIAGSGAAAHGVAGAGAGAVTLGGLAEALHLRYELRGEVRMGGVLVNRRVRAYSRDTGELLGQADTVAGKFRVHAGFAETECYATPIDLSPGATDWLPPTANRILAVLASDTA